MWVQVLLSWTGAVRFHSSLDLRAPKIRPSSGARNRWLLRTGLAFASRKKLFAEKLKDRPRLYETCCAIRSRRKRFFGSETNCPAQKASKKSVMGRPSER